MNKRNSLKVQSEAYDMCRQVIWKSEQEGKVDKKRAEKMLVDLDNSLFFNYQMLHDIIQGKDAAFIERIRPDGMVLIGHEHQAVYFSLNWDDIHALSEKIKKYEQRLGEEKNNIIKKNEEQLIQIKQMLNERLIDSDAANRYLRAMYLPEHITTDWLKDHVVTGEEMAEAAQRSINRSWEKEFAIKGPKVSIGPPPNE